MDYYEKIEITTRRDYLVVKGNELIQKSRFELSLPEQKTIAFICSMIKPIDTIDRINNSEYQLEYEFNIRDYCKICGINYDSGKNYSEIKSTLRKLSDKSMWLELNDGMVLCRWLSKVWINKRSGISKIRLDEDLVPFLFDLSQKFTQYQLYNILAMKSAFSIRIYELMKSYSFQKTKTFDLDKLKSLLYVQDVKSYKDFSLFRKKVLEKATEEINELTDINIEFIPITKGRKVVKVKFNISIKDTVKRYISSQETINKLDRYN